MSNLLYFKFGGVVGFTNTVAADNTPWPGADAVKFNPVTGSPVYSGYASIPSYTEADWDADREDVSASTYHHKTNVLAGKGDPCKLVGLTITQIRAGTVDNGDWRLPTDVENGAYGSPIYVAGNGWVGGTTPTAGIHTGVISTSFLPAAGERTPSGNTYWVGNRGYFWSSLAHNATSGLCLRFSDGTVNTSALGDGIYTNGLSVRCVPQS
jgi:hypothetical protein